MHEISCLRPRVLRETFYVQQSNPRDHTFSTQAKFFGKLTFLFPLIHTSFFGKFCARTKWMILFYLQHFKRVSKSYFMICSCAVIILFGADLYKSAFSTYSFQKQAFRLSVLCVFCQLFFLIQCDDFKDF